ncbi:NAD(P)-dependent dehydrogenase, short-chain alcohol dehydrogenase family [Variovorax sp. HW608]|uniref:SDR family oxidoreductase n=1 Tax=Variovorax sp. HW608 TaxID=1034889 RepID=UPI00081FCAA1|nr:SDR family oxidoreductase [Variovorax sp. HW608]SCK19764.1 NAD(P)-dependent dehydrogenase, short-chain alcohol dehydrogenase family [Variovorax sp. HW608]
MSDASGPVATSDQPVAIITAAGRGIGAAIAHELHGRGYRLALMSPSGNAERLATELGAIGLTGSVEDKSHLAQLVAMTLDAYGRIDAVVNHTGHPPKGDLLEIADEDWQVGNDLVFLPVIRMARLVTPCMLSQRKGAFLNITTFAALEPSLKFPVSCAYRAAVASFTKLYADRYAPENIRMNALLPGYTDSLNHAAETADSIPMKRIGSVVEVAKTAAFLLSDDAAYITGQNIRVDGGITRHL